MRKQIWKTTIAMTAVVLLVAGCGKEKNVQESPEKLPEIKTEVNLIVNAGLEEWNGYKPAGWTMRIFAGTGNKITFYGKSDKTESGESSLYMRGLFDTEKWMAATQRFPVRPGHEIVLSARMMTENLKQNKGQEDNAGAYLRFLGKDGKRLSDRYFADAWTGKRKGTTGWKVEREKTIVPDGAYTVELGLLNQMTGIIYFDDVSLVIRERVEWQSKKAKFITYNWLEGHPFPPEDMKRVSVLIENIAKEAEIKNIEGRINYYLYPDEATFMRILQKPKYRTAARWDKKELHDVLSFNDHEIIHLILYDIGFPPIGMSKGLVFYYRARYNHWDMHTRCKRFLLEKRIPALYKTIHPDKWRVVDHTVVVPAWASFVEYLIDKYGLDTFKTLYAETSEMNDPGPFSARFKDIYGIGFQDADRAWRLYIMRYEGNALADTLPDAEEAP